MEVEVAVARWLEVLRAVATARQTIAAAGAAAAAAGAAAAGAAAGAAAAPAALWTLSYTSNTHLAALYDAVRNAAGWTAGPPRSARRGMPQELPDSRLAPLARAPVALYVPLCADGGDRVELRGAVRRSGCPELRARDPEPRVRATPRPITASQIEPASIGAIRVASEAAGFDTGGCMWPWAPFLDMPRVLFDDALLRVLCTISSAALHCFADNVPGIAGHHALAAELDRLVSEARRVAANAAAAVPARATNEDTIAAVYRVRALSSAPTVFQTVLESADLPPALDVRVVLALLALPGAVVRTDDTPIFADGVIAGKLRELRAVCNAALGVGRGVVAAVVEEARARAVAEGALGAMTWDRPAAAAALGAVAYVRYTRDACEAVVTHAAAAAVVERRGLSPSVDACVSCLQDVARMFAACHAFAAAFGARGFVESLDAAAREAQELARACHLSAPDAFLLRRLSAACSSLLVVVAR